ncbi:DUF2786 domain-containing protein [Patescibacteria group bacterium]|nr:DUF2786 domain-containing protein [Patescibacteria group bacterium]
MTDTQEKYANKIAKLLAKAESTSPEEAEILIAKAQELMAQYAVEEAMIDAARGVERDEIEQRTVVFTGNNRAELADLAWRICQVNDCKVVQWQTTVVDEEGRKAVRVRRNWRSGQYEAEVTNRKKAIKYEITGFRSDLERILLLESSLRLQAISSLTNWWRDEGKAQYDWETYSHKVRIKQEFLEGFTNSVHSKLQTAKRTGQQAAVKVEAKRTHATDESAGESVALVLRSRKDRVDDWYDKHYGKLRKGRSSYKQSLSGSAYHSGTAAGARADVGQSQVRGRKGLNR